MPLPIQSQLDIAVSGWSQGDFDLMEQALVSPDTLTFDETKTMAQNLGLRGGFLSAATNIVTDPTVIIGFLLARKFPTSAFLKGTVPQRFIETGAQFTGLSTIGRTVEGFFRGTHVPRLTALFMKRRAEVLKLGNRMFDKLLFRPNWSNEMETVSLLMEGRNPVGATPELRTLAGSLRNDMDELWGFLSRTHKVTGGFDQANLTRATSEAFATREAPKYLRDYLPHIPLLGTESTFQVSGREALARFGKNKSAQAIALAGENPGYVWTVDGADRLVSSFERYQAFMHKTQGQVFNPRMFRRQRHGIALQSSEGAGDFVTDLNIIFQKYIHSTAQTYALNAPLTAAERAFVSIPSPTGVGHVLPTAEPPIVQIINQGLDATGGVVSRRPIAGTNKFQEFLVPGTVNAPTLGALRNLVRNIMGKASDDEILFGNVMNAIRSKTQQALGRTLNNKQMTQVESGISILEQRSKDRLFINRVTSYFYGTVLLNPLSGMKNLLQPFLTTAPAIGIGPTLRGVRELGSRMPVYFREFNRQKGLLAAGERIPFVQRMNLAQEKAFHRTFPELAETGVAVDPRAFDLDLRLLETSPITGTTRFRSLDEFNRFMLQPFTQTEIANKVITFYGGRHALRDALRVGTLEAPIVEGKAIEGATLDRFLNFEAASLTAATQFAPGPGSRTVLQSHIPPPLRMFMSFPIRLGNFFAESTVRGALTDQQLQTAGFFERMTGGRNWGPVARTFLLGRTLNLGLREGLGVDMGDALGVTGPFTNIAPSGQLFAPLPIAPIPSVALGLASFATTRDLKEMQPLELPLLGEIPVPKTLVPGGIAISRASRALRQYRPDLGGFVDDDERLMFRGDTTDLILSMVGIPLEKQRRLREKVGQVQANRGRVRQIRRRYAVAVRNYDTDEMTKLEGTFAKEFPEFGRLGLSRQDLRRYEQSARLTSLQRVIRSLGKQARYLEDVTLEHDPDLVAVGE